MKIAFYAPFKPLGHKNPSGDLIIGKGIVEFLTDRGHQIKVQSTLRARWIYFKPWAWPKLAFDCIKCIKNLHKTRPDLWLTYHSYYKAPDIIGPLVCRILNIKYVIFQGIYATKPKRRFKTIAGFYLNRSALLRADHVFTNKSSDLKNLKRVIQEDRLTYIRPGIKPCEFKKDEKLGVEQRKKWGIKNKCHVILTAGMFRNDVKTRGLSWLIRCCNRLVQLNMDFHLVIAGAGRMESHLKNLAERHIQGHYTFAGKIKRDKMYQFYSSGDVFAFPGISESLGMVYLESQSCSLPVIAFKNGGIPEVVKDRKTGFLLPMYECKRFSDMLIYLLNNQAISEQMGKDAKAYVKKYHDIEHNYLAFEKTLFTIAQQVTAT